MILRLTQEELSHRATSPFLQNEGKPCTLEMIGEERHFVHPLCDNPVTMGFFWCLREGCVKGRDIRGFTLLEVVALEVTATLLTISYSNEDTLA